MSFEWHPGQPPPPIQAHSRAKLVVLRRYLRAYFDRLNVGVPRDRFKLDLVDGFCGGGIFRDGDAVLAGTPVIMLEELAAAKERLNAKRRKPLHFDCKCYFVDVEMEHTDHLRQVLIERGYDLDKEEIVVRNNKFENEVEAIIDEIRRRQPRSGRAIFLLDQTGYSQVELMVVARIFRELPTAEVILTFAADVLVNFLSATPEVVKAVAPLELSNHQVVDLVNHRDGAGGRAVAQRTLRDHIRNVTGATFDTPFFIRPRDSRWALWIIHLSRHPTARDVMMQCHWDVKNTFEHYGRGGLDMLGWDPLREPDSWTIFNFEELDSQHMKDDLLTSMPRELFNLASDSPVTVDAIHHTLANRTAARFSDLDKIILQLFREREFDLLTPTGKRRLRSLQNLQPSDLVCFPDTPLFPILSRVRSS